MATIDMRGVWTEAKQVQETRNEVNRGGYKPAAAAAAASMSVSTSTRTKTTK